MNEKEALEIAAISIEMYMLGDWGQDLVGDNEGRVYLQDSNTYDGTEIFFVRCKGIGNMDMSYYREGWDCDNLSDEEVIHQHCVHGDVSDDIEILAEKILEATSDYENAQ